MSHDLATLDAQIAELTAQREALVSAANAEAITAAKLIEKSYDYTVEWTHPAQCRIERQASAEYRAQIDAFYARYPNFARGSYNGVEPFVGGMTYSILEGGYVIGGGGSVVVQFGDGNRSTFDPEPIRPDTLAALRRGEVPLDIRRP